MENIINLRYKRTLFIGLGGAGAKTLCLLKQKIKNANAGKIPKQIKFLLIDTNATELSNFREFDSSEKICIAVREPYLRYLHDKGLATHKFIPEQNAHSLLALERGAGQIRSNGHFAVIENQYSNKLVRIFRERADELEDIDIMNETLEKDPKIEIRLVFSIAGGTGGGTFLPISTLLRTAIKHCELTAYIYSATHYSKKVENSAKYSVMQNAYASLCELDYMMHFGRKNRDYENVKFNFGPDVSTQQIEQTNRPFEEVYYIDKHTSLPNSDSIEFAYNEIHRIQENTAEAMHVSATNIISSHTGTIDNVRQKIMEGQFDVGDKFAWISGFGIAEIYFNPLDEDNPEVINACRKAISARIKQDTDLSEEEKEKVASYFIRIYKFDESHGKNDNDPILRKFGEENDIIDKCNHIVDKANNDRGTSNDFKVNIENFVPQNIPSSSIIKDTNLYFQKCINEMIQNLIDYDSFKDIYIKGYNEGISLAEIKSIIIKIKEKIDQSINQLNKEEISHKQNQEQADNSIKKILSDNTTADIKTNKIFSQWQTLWKNKTDTNNNNLEAIINTIKAQQKIGLINFIFYQRDLKAIEVFNNCKNYLDEVCNTIDDWQQTLVLASKYAETRNVHISSYDDTHKHMNKVEVQMVDLKEGFRLDYESIQKISTRRKSGILQSGQSIYDQVCKILKHVSGSLQKYLSKGIEEINELAGDNRITVNRTDCQKKIDRLIDLSTPTIQIDKHGFGDRVKDDNFWYIMTDCPETTINEKTEEKYTKEKSVGEMLKNLLEQNSLDVRINLIHVPGWNNKALLYRVVGAIPPFFVSGVCSGSEGGYTLEYCYEELKKTKHTYTPFSHELLRKKLEKGITVLKPNEPMDKEKIMSHWVNFNYLGYIHFDSIKGTKGTYTIKSDKEGRLLTNDFSDGTKILILGESRTEAFDTFARFCNSLLEEYIDYQNIINPYEDLQEYEDLIDITGIQYFDRVLTDLKWKGEIIHWKELKKHLSLQDSEYDILFSEFTFVNKRKDKYEAKKQKEEKKEALSKGFRDDKK